MKVFRFGVGPPRCYGNIITLDVILVYQYNIRSAFLSLMWKQSLFPFKAWVSRRLLGALLLQRSHIGTLNLTTFSLRSSRQLRQRLFLTVRFLRVGYQVRLPFEEWVQRSFYIRLRWMSTRFRISRVQKMSLKHEPLQKSRKTPCSDAKFWLVFLYYGHFSLAALCLRRFYSDFCIESYLEVFFLRFTSLFREKGRSIQLKIRFKTRNHSDCDSYRRGSKHNFTYYDVFADKQETCAQFRRNRLFSGEISIFSNS